MLVARSSSLAARDLEIPLCLPYLLYLLTLLTYLLYLFTYPLRNGFSDEVDPLEKREPVNRQPSTVNRQPLTEIPSCRTADGGWRIFRARSS